MLQNHPPEKKNIWVCNADEGDPGAFMDRSVLEGDPHSSDRRYGHRRIRHGRVREALSTSVRNIRLPFTDLRSLWLKQEKKRYLGKNLFGTDYSFDLRIKAGAGAFVCGEETALIAFSRRRKRNAETECLRSLLRRVFWQKQPTNINNVETFGNVPWIISNGGAAFAAIGTAQSKGTKVFALAGKIKKGGLVEVPMGLPLKDVIFGIGDGIKNDKAFQGCSDGRTFRRMYPRFSDRHPL